MSHPSEPTPINVATVVRTCRRCGCTDDRACPGGCWWVSTNLCSTCDEAGPVDGAALIAAERRRQIEVEGYTLEHDAQHGHALIHNAANALAQGDPAWWPREWVWKPKNRLRDLIRAGGLFQAAADLPDVDGWLRMRSESARDRVARMIDELLTEARAVLTADAPSSDEQRPVGS